MLRAFIALLLAPAAIYAPAANAQTPENIQRAQALVSETFNEDITVEEKIRLMMAAIEALGPADPRTDATRARYLGLLGVLQLGNDNSAAAVTHTEELAVRLRLSPDAETTAKARTRLAFALTRLDRFDEAEGELRLVLARPILLEEAGLRGEAYSRLAWVFHRRAFAGSEGSPDENSLTQRELYDCMASIWQTASGSVNEAEALADCASTAERKMVEYRRGQIQLRASQARVDQITADIRTGETGRPDSREATATRIAAMTADAEGDRSLVDASASAALAQIYLVNGENLLARELYSETLAILIPAKGADDLDILLMQAGYAVALIGTGSVAEGVALQRDIIDRYTRQGDPFDLWAVQFRSSLAQSLEELGDYEEAEQEVQALINFLDRDPSYWKDEYLVVALLRAKQLGRSGDYAEVEKLLRKAVVVARTEPFNNSMARALDQLLGETLIDVGRHDEGSALLRTIAEDRFSVFCPDRSGSWTYDGDCTANTDMIFSTGKLADTWRENGRRSAATRLYRHVGNMALARTLGRYSMSAQARSDYRDMSSLHARFVSAAWFEQ